MKHVKSSSFKEFTCRQSSLNHFLWTTELIYGIVKQQKILEQYPQDQLAWEALNHIQAEAWFPTTKSRSKGDDVDSRKYKYRGTVSEMRRQLDKNFVIVLWSVATMFVAEFETFVESRFPIWVEWMIDQKKKTKRDDSPLVVPAPTMLLNGLNEAYRTKEIKSIDPSITLKADLMKKIRNLYVHKGLKGIPREVDNHEINQWVTWVTKGGSPYSVDQAKAVVSHVIGGAIEKSQATVDGKNLGEEFFYALFMFTNIHNFAVALDRSFPNEN